MKDTDYKLNRKRLNESEDYTYLKRKIGYLINRGILEEVQDTKEDLPYTEEIANRKLQEEPKQAIDNMFGNPLEQVEKLTVKKTMAQCACGCTQEYPHSHLVAGKKCECEEGRDTKVNAGGFEYNEDIKKLYKQSKPFLDGMKPSEWINEQTAMSDKDMTIRNWGKPATVLDSTLTMMSKTMEVIDILVEELKKKGSL